MYRSKFFMNTFYNDVSSVHNSASLICAKERNRQSTNGMTMLKFILKHSFIKYARQYVSLKYARQYVSLNVGLICAQVSRQY
jgi:hypothetical protein